MAIAHRFFLPQKFKNFSRRSEVGLVIILTLIVVLFFFGWLINLSQRECKGDKDCGSEAYCGSDFSCHTYPTIQKTVVQYSLLMPSVILGIAIIAAAIIFRWGSIRNKEEPKAVLKEERIGAPNEAAEITEPYYKEGANLRTP